MDPIHGQNPLMRPDHAGVPDLVSAAKKQANFEKVMQEHGPLIAKEKELITKATKPGLESLGSQVVAPLQKGLKKGLNQHIKGQVVSVDPEAGTLVVRNPSGQSISIQMAGHAKIKLDGEFKTLEDLAPNDFISVVGKQDGNVVTAKKIVNLPPVEIHEFNRLASPRETIVSIDSAKNLVTLQGANGQTRSVQVSPTTQMMANGGEVKTIADLTPGETVTFNPEVDPLEVPGLQKMRGVLVATDPVANTLTIRALNGREMTIQLNNETRLLGFDEMEKLPLGSVLAVIIAKQAEELFAARKVMNLSTPIPQEQVDPKNQPVGIYLAENEKTPQLPRLMRIKGILIANDIEKGLLSVYGLDGRKWKVAVTDNTWIVIRGRSKKLEDLEPNFLVAIVGVTQGEDLIIAKKVKAT